MRKKCFFHLGFHKTASTYLQALIDKNRDSALQPYHVVNRVREETRQLKIALVLYGRKQSQELRSAASIECNNILEDFESSGKENLLLSEEVLLGPMLRQQGENGLYTLLEPRLTVLIEEFACYELHFLFYTRETSSWLQSLYNQAVKQVRFAGTFDDYVKDVDLSDVWGTLHRRITTAAQGRAVHFFPIENDKDTAFGTGDSLLRYIGLGEEELSQIIRPRNSVNASWPRPLLEFMRLLNASDIDDKSLDIVRSIVKKKILPSASFDASLVEADSAIYPFSQPAARGD